MDACPLAYTKPTSQGVLPVQLATRHHMPKDVILSFLKADMPMKIDSKNRRSTRRKHYHSWWYITTGCGDMCLDAVDEFLLQVVEKHLILQLVRTIGPDGRTRVFEAVTNQCKSLFAKHLRFLDRYELNMTKDFFVTKVLKVFHARGFGGNENTRTEATSPGSKRHTSRKVLKLKSKTNQASDLSVEVTLNDTPEGSGFILRCFGVKEMFNRELNARRMYGFLPVLKQ